MSHRMVTPICASLFLLDFLEINVRLDVGVPSRPSSIVQRVCGIAIPDLVQPSILQPTSLDQEQDASWKEHHRAGTCERKRPAHVVVLPVGHPVARVAVASEENDGEQSEDPGEHQARSVGDQQVDVVLVVFRAHEEQQRQQHRHQQQRERQREEELNGDEEPRQDVVVNNVIFLLEDPHAAVEADVVEPVDVLEVVQAHLPEP